MSTAAFPSPRPAPRTSTSTTARRRERSCWCRKRRLSRRSGGRKAERGAVEAEDFQVVPCTASWPIENPPLWPRHHRASKEDEIFDVSWIRPARLHLVREESSDPSIDVNDAARVAEHDAERRVADKQLPKVLQER